VNITVEAAIDSASLPECGSPGPANGYKDTLVKQIQVKMIDNSFCMLSSNLYS